MPVTPHFLILTNYPTKSVLKRLFPNFAEDLMKYPVMQRGTVAYRPRQIKSVDDHNIAIALHPFIDEENTVTFIYGIEGKLHREDKHYKVVMCEIRLPYMTSGNDRVLKAIEYARASVWRVAVMTKLFTEGNDAVENSVHEIVKELSDTTLMANCESLSFVCL